MSPPELRTFFKQAARACRSDMEVIAAVLPQMVEGLSSFLSKRWYGTLNTLLERGHEQAFQNAGAFLVIVAEESGEAVHVAADVPRMRLLANARVQILKQLGNAAPQGVSLEDHLSFRTALDRLLVETIGTVDGMRSSHPAIGKRFCACLLRIHPIANELDGRAETLQSMQVAQFDGDEDEATVEMLTTQMTAAELPQLGTAAFMQMVAGEHIGGLLANAGTQYVPMPDIGFEPLPADAHPNTTPTREMGVATSLNPPGPAPFKPTVGLRPRRRKPKSE